jgi:hypothetical protein
MKSVAFVAAVALTLSPLSLALAQNQLPQTTVTAPKPKPTPPVVNRQESRAPAGTSSSILPDHPDPETPNVRARDWNAPGVMNLNYMTEAQFDAFKAAHPTTAFYGRCYAGQDPDPNIRAFMLRHVPHGCKG